MRTVDRTATWRIIYRIDQDAIVIVDVFSKKPQKTPTATWRIIYRIDQDAIVIVDVFSKKPQKTPKSIIESAKNRLRAYNEME